MLPPDPPAANPFQPARPLQMKEGQILRSGGEGGALLDSAFVDNARSTPIEERWAEVRGHPGFFR